MAHDSQRSPSPLPELDDPLRGESRAERPTSSLTVRLVGALAVTSACVALLLKLVAPRPAHVPLGIAGFGLGEPLAVGRGLELVGPSRYRARALVLDEPALCVLSTTSEQRVERIECELERTDGPAQRDASRRRRLLATLRELYGDESASDGDSSFEWRNTRAFLRLSGGGGPAPGGTHLVNGWAPSGGPSSSE